MVPSGINIPSGEPFYALSAISGTHECGFRYKAFSLKGALAMFVISIERTSGTPTNEIMSKICLWLDHKEIEPASFRPTMLEGTASVEVGFRNEDEAELFRQEFDGLALPVR